MSAAKAAVNPSLRLRLAVAGTAALLVALVVSFFGLSLLFERHVERRAAAELTLHLDQLIAALGIRERRLTLAREPADPRFARPLSGLYWQIESEGETLRSRSLWDTELVVPPLEPGAPAGVDIESDELAFYPLIYWPIDPDSPMPSEAAIARIDAYMQQGGTVLFDTRDQYAAGFDPQDAVGPATMRLRDILGSLNIPPLEPVPDDHVLTKSFYIMPAFPGRYDGSPLWVEASLNTTSSADRPVRTGDGVTPIMITANDFAGAWAVDANGDALLPTVPPNPLQRIYALRAGVNIMMYMLTGNYKSDQVHVPVLLERLGQ